MSDLQTNLAHLEAKAFGERVTKMTTVELGAVICDIILQGTDGMDEQSHHGGIVRLGMPKGRTPEEDERLVHYMMADTAAEVAARMHATRPHQIPGTQIDHQEMEHFRRMMLQRCATATTGVQEIATRILTDQKLLENIRQGGQERDPLPAASLHGIPFRAAIAVVNRQVGFHDTPEDDTSPQWAYEPPSASQENPHPVTAAIDFAYTGFRGRMIDACRGMTLTPSQLTEVDSRPVSEHSANHISRLSVFANQIREMHRFLP